MTVQLKVASGGSAELSQADFRRLHAPLRA